MDSQPIMKYSMKGIAIMKESITLKQQNKIKNDLTITPYVPPTSMQPKCSFPLYRESNQKLYVPRFYAKEKFDFNVNADDFTKYCDFKTISNNNNFAFEGELRPYQNNIINAYLNESKKSGCGLLEIPCGRGKCLGKNTPVLLYNGKVVFVQDVVNNDILIGDDLKPRIVSGVHSGYARMYRISQGNKGIEYRVNDSHILTVFDVHKNKTIDIQVEECLYNMHRKKCVYRGKRIDMISKQVIYTPLEILRDNEDEYYGFTVDQNNRFLLGDGTITHNTVMALNIVSHLKVKTLVIVHKEFLLNQWVERIEQFLPHIKVGRIQGKTIQVDNFDIVIGMLQSLSMKEYSPKLFQQFGLTIIDECHHIGAEVFSRSLFKIVTPYMIGLSATMERKDQTSFVFKYFLGDIVYSEKQSVDHEVLVRTIYYESKHDQDYANVEFNFKGQVHYSKMIKKICEYEYRTEFILRVLQDIRTENENRQIMILAHNKSLLNVLFKTIEERNIGTVGYYIGGMKEHQLKESEEKQIIVATYAMAEEALDIKTLSALILATPKTDVTQAVGRILRTKHDDTLVIDIVDQHDIFQRQWLKRKRYYKKCNYTIKEIHSHYYHNDFKRWNSFVKKKSTKQLQQGKCMITFEST